MLPTKPVPLDDEELEDELLDEEELEDEELLEEVPPVGQTSPLYTPTLSSIRLTGLAGIPRLNARRAVASVAVAVNVNL